LLHLSSDRVISTEEVLELPDRAKHEHFLLGIFENCNKTEGELLQGCLRGENQDSEYWVTTESKTAEQGK